MGQVNMSRLNPALLLKYSECARLDPYNLSGAVTMALFEELACCQAVTPTLLIENRTTNRSGYKNNARRPTQRIVA